MKGAWHEIRSKDGRSGRGAADPAQHRIRCEAGGHLIPTLLSWMKEPEFQTLYRGAKRAAFSQAIARLQQGATAAATALLRTIIDPNTPASVRVRASECVLNHALKAIENEEIEARVVAL